MAEYDIFSAEPEYQLVGRMIINPQSIDGVPEIESDMWINDKLQKCYTTLLQLRDTGKFITATGLTLALGRPEWSEQIIQNAVDKCPMDGTTVQTFADAIINAGTKRKLYQIATQIHDMSKSDYRADIVLDNAVTNLSKIDCRSDDNSEITANDAICTSIDRIKNPGNYKAECIKTGIANLDLMTGGVARKMVTVVGAPPAMGKSAFFINLMANMASMGVKIYASILEDINLHVANRIIARRAQIDSSKLYFNNGITTDEIQKIETFARDFAGQNIILNDRPNQSAAKIKRAVARQKARGGLDVLIVDHLGELTDTRRSYESTTENGLLFRDIAKEFDIAVLLASQLNRKNRGSMPQKTDLRDSGRVEEFARAIWMLYRPNEDDDTAPESVFNVNVCKATHGRTCVVDLECDLQHMDIW